MKKTKFALLALLMTLCLFGCNIGKKTDYNLETDALQFKRDYEEYNTGENSILVNIQEQNPIKYSSANEVFSLFENGTGILYLGFPTCPWCRNMISILLDAADQEDVEIVYYLNPRSIKEKEVENYNHLKQILDDYLSTNSAGEKTLYVPDVYFIKDGTVLGHHLGTVDSQSSPYVPLTENEKEELTNIYRNYIQQLK